MASGSCHKVIIDCDPGIDDAHAIIMLLTQKNIEVIAITTVFGNEPLKSTTRNAIRVLKMCKRLDIPVYMGCSSPLTVDWPQQYKYDFLSKGVISGVDPVDMSYVQQEHASNALCRLVSKDPGSITLLSLAPLTNIAVALMLDPSFGNKLKNCVMMGGGYIGEENITAEAEYNWYCDPEAAHAVLAGLNKLITLVPLEICLESSLSWEWHACIKELPNVMSQFIQMAEEYKRTDVSKKFHIFDELAAACLINAAVICETRSVRASVELHNSDTRGQMIVDLNKAQEKTENVCIVTKVDQTLFEKIITAAFSSL